MFDYTRVLPLETWLAVMEFLAVPPPISDTEAAPLEASAAILRSSPEIRIVSSLSRFFLQLVDPYRFREVHFVVNLRSSPMLKLRRIEEFLDLLDHRQEVKSWIRTLSIGRKCDLGVIVRQDRVDREQHHALQPKIHKVVPELRGLSSLWCGYIDISSSLFDTILQLPHLEELHLEDLRFIPGTTNINDSPIGIGKNGPPLRSLAVRLLGPLSTPATQALIHLLQRETLEELIYWPPHAVDLDTFVSLLRVISTYIPDYVFTSLRKLNILLPAFNADVQRFVQFGERCPNLESLAIRWSYLEDSLEEPDPEEQLTRSGLAEHAFPALQEFSGPLALAPIFVQGRPVHTVISDILYIRSGDEYEETIAPRIAALRPRIPLRVLHLAAWDSNEADIEAIAQYHPDLEELIYVYRGNYGVVGQMLQACFYDTDSTPPRSFLAGRVGLRDLKTPLGSLQI
ncbi:hypothetical protein FRC01_006608 [Tulasnella sp. 417]|nr:hypothetical protein FRC01_006608 [Tulasnella sp. 417]